MKCAHPDCDEAAVCRCTHCDRPFCTTHGRLGGDRPDPHVGLVAVPSECWLCEDEECW